MTEDITVDKCQYNWLKIGMKQKSVSKKEYKKRKRQQQQGQLKRMNL